MLLILTTSEMCYDNDDDVLINMEINEWKLLFCSSFCSEVTAKLFTDGSHAMDT